ncbi:docking protein 1 isoform X2 [Hemicordylus capensis]|uniref:docking protein 1 isoform X2 n=1 Tax=Hemicordylus capensis TaxID=884348 RepID=UPI002303F379|nr:docking protein 1 isoform X2 [Hemicordylus capensis]
MDPPVKEGALLLQQPPAGLRLGAKRWKKSWFVLYPASAHGVARLEFFDCKEGAAAAAADRAGTKRPDKKIVRLADCLSVAPVPDGAPKDSLAAFRLETSERSYLFAAQPPETAQWVAKLCETAAFLGAPGKVAQPAAEPGGGQALKMATNAIYYSREEASEFWVTVQKTEAAERCLLHGPYVLKASGDSLVLGDPHSKQPLYTWPYRLLRRYGRDKVMFSFEAGRRCESGPGNFTFETQQGNEIFHVVEAAIQAQKAQAEENRQSSSSAELEASGGAAQIQSALASSLSLGEGQGPAPEKQGPRTALSTRLSSAAAAQEEALAVPPPKGPGPRDPPAPWPSPPPRSPLSGVPSEDAGNVYSEPLDAIKGPRPRPDPLYADPVDSWRQAGGGEAEGGLPSARRLYERVGPGAGACQGPREGGAHIYDEPEGRAPRAAPPPAAIYEEARLPHEAWRTQGLESPAGYELPAWPGAVPAFPPKAGPKAPKPCPAPKPPRAHKKAPPPGTASKPLPSPAPGPKDCALSGSGSSSSSSKGAPGGAALYSCVLKPPRGPAGGPELSVDESRPASVYEDLGEI